MALHIAPTVRLIRKYHLQVVELEIVPPTRGLEAAAMAHVTPKRDIHFARSPQVSIGNCSCGPKRGYVGYDYVDQTHYTSLINASDPGGNSHVHVLTRAAQCTPYFKKTYSNEKD
jgi:hypothetical protein